MLVRTIAISVLASASLAGCGKQADREPDQPETAAARSESKLGIKTLKNGYGKAAVPGDFVTVHYTGWLYDETAEDRRGAKFDSSIDRDQKFQFPLGAGRVIRGWDEGVQGMLVGETRELTIPADMAYGDRGAGGGLIPPGATLVFEIELFGADAPGATD